MSRIKKILVVFLVVFGLLAFTNGFLVWKFYRWLQIPDGRTNFLLLGVAGGDHAGRDLADTIIFISLDHKTGKVLSLSLPRDIWVASLRTKLNSVYHYQGLDKTKGVVSQILRQPIDYGVLVDFNLFGQVIDNLGGIQVEVERSFDDYRYPIPGKENDLCDGDKEYNCRYEHLHFEAGNQNMNADLALKYVRSRYAEGEEGTDFARSNRQQRVMAAIKDKIFSWPFLSSPKKILQLLDVVSSNIKTDIPQEKYDELLKIFLKMRGKNIKMSVLNNGYLISPKTSVEYDNLWVLIPEAGDWTKVGQYVDSLIKDQSSL